MKGKYWFSQCSICKKLIGLCNGRFNQKKQIYGKVICMFVPRREYTYHCCKHKHLQRDGTPILADRKIKRSYFQIQI